MESSKVGPAFLRIDLERIKIGLSNSQPNIIE